MAATAPSPLFVLRHGETEWNVAGRMQGAEGDSPLTPLGRQQAAAMGRLVRDLGAGALPVVCSPQGRARETARLAFGDGPVRVDPRLREIAMADLSGLSRAEVVARWPDLVTGTGVGWQFDVPGGETFETLRARAAAVLRDLAGPAVLVTHGITARVLRGLALGLDRAETLALGGGQGVVWRLEAGTQTVFRP